VSFAYYINSLLKNPFKEVDLMMGDVQAESVLAKFVKNGEWDFHHVEAVRHNSLFALHDNENETSKAGKSSVLRRCSLLSSYGT
jgi:hypothetical protein